jgi:hypothetical protein
MFPKRAYASMSEGGTLASVVAVRWDRPLFRSFSTGVRDEADRVTGVAIGAVDYLTKPSNIMS